LPTRFPISTEGPTRTPTSSPPTSQQPTRLPTSPPRPTVTTFPTPFGCDQQNRDVYLLELLSEFTPKSTLLDRSTPQGMAYLFLVRENNPSFVCSQTIIQRYGLATLYFATQGDRWTNNDGWLSPSQECDWFGVECDSNGFAVAVNLRKFKMYRN
jgi:hypothetical protein